MNEHDFALWLQGFVELTGGQQPTEEQWILIVEHLKTVFNKVTPGLPPHNFPVYAPFENPTYTGATEFKPGEIIC